MCRVIGVETVDDLFDEIPEHVRIEDARVLDLPESMSEMEVEAFFRKMSHKSISASQVPFFVGGGLYRHHVPAVVDHLIQRSEFLTSYTPYQPEVSQGTLTTVFEFQTQVAMLAGLDVANASLYDGATACAEASAMAARVTKRKKVLASGSLNPRYVEVMKTYGEHNTTWTLETLPADIDGSEDVREQITSDLAAVVVQNPTVFGHCVDYTPLAEKCKEQGVLLILCTSEVVSLGLLKNAGEMGADIFVAEGQSLGNALNFGGPTVGLFACRQKLIRQMPGRVVGETLDADGNRAFVLTLATREQHIRREKATSNICTSAGLCALAFSIHATLLGEEGLRTMALLNHSKACELADMISKTVQTVEIVNQTYFNELTIKLPEGIRGSTVIQHMADRGVLGGVAIPTLYGPDSGLEDNYIISAVTELTTTADMEMFCKFLGKMTVKTSALCLE